MCVVCTLNSTLANKPIFSLPNTSNDAYTIYYYRQNVTNLSHLTQYNLIFRQKKNHLLPYEIGISFFFGSLSNVEDGVFAFYYFDVIFAFTTKCV